jgi:hypothetical protein
MLPWPFARSWYRKRRIARNDQAQTWHAVPVHVMTFVVRVESRGKKLEERSMECVAIIACSAVVIFAKLALVQDLNPILWGLLAMIVYAGAPAYLIMVRKASIWDAPLVWISSFGGLFVLFVIQSIVAARKRSSTRSGGVRKGKGKAKRRADR